MKKANGWAAYSNNSKYLTSYTKDSDSFSSQTREEGFSMSFAAGLKVNYNKSNGFSVSVLTPEDIAKEQERVNKAVKIIPAAKGGNINIYC